MAACPSESNAAPAAGNDGSNGKRGPSRSGRTRPRGPVDADGGQRDPGSAARDGDGSLDKGAAARRFEVVRIGPRWAQAARTRAIQIGDRVVTRDQQDRRRGDEDAATADGEPAPDDEGVRLWRRALHRRGRAVAARTTVSETSAPSARAISLRKGIAPPRGRAHDVASRRERECGHGRDDRVVDPHLERPPGSGSAWRESVAPRASRERRVDRTRRAPRRPPADRCSPASARRGTRRNASASSPSPSWQVPMRYSTDAVSRTARTRSNFSSASANRPASSSRSASAKRARAAAARGSAVRRGGACARRHGAEKAAHGEASRERRSPEHPVSISDGRAYGPAAEKQSW